MKTFEELGVIAPIRQAIEEIGFESPMPVQEAVIPLLLGSGIDIIALAQTGTGKTAAFGLPLLQNIDASKRYPQALILAPTRELGVQIAKDLTSFATHLDDVRVVAVYGGASIETQIKEIKRGAHIIVATPGRLLDLMRRNALSLSEIRDVVLDEADEMLNMGFSESLDAILAEVPQERHMLLFSATMPDEISRISNKYMHNPKEVQIGERNVTNTNIKHIYYMVSARDKYLALKRIADVYPNIYGIVFCRTRRETQEIADKLIQDGYNADALHGDLSQQQRDTVMQKFRVRNLQMLIATDVAARGLDVDDLTHVIHYGLPDDPESYTHRSGRTARAGKSGISIAICHSREKGRLRDISKLTNVDFERAKVPSAQEICEKQLYNFIDKVEQTIPNEDRIPDFIYPIEKRLAWLDRDALIHRIIYMELERLLRYYEKAPEIAEVDERPERQSSRERKGREERKSTVAQKGYQRLRINVGKRDKVFPNTMIDIVNHCVGRFIEIGKIDIYDSFAFFEVPERDAEEVKAEISSFDYMGRDLRVEVAKPEGARRERSSKREYSRGGGERRDGNRRANREFSKGSARRRKRD